MSKVHITLYGLMLSPAVRGAALACHALGVTYDFKEVNLMTGEHMAPDFIQMNPLHTVPVIKDGDFTLFDSHAIAVYLAERTGHENWYPKDPKKRAIVNQRLLFNSSTLFPAISTIVKKVLFENHTTLAPEDVIHLEGAVMDLDKLLGDKLWMASDDHPTIADCLVVAVVSTIVAIVTNIALPERLDRWQQRCEHSLPHFGDNRKGAESLGGFVRSKLVA